ncbi:MAG TPA: VacJ family lipoprotein [Myxococcota bacterium]|nr:VacJ family lipoprotein [Myxococcota bacterium]
MARALVAALLLLLAATATAQESNGGGDVQGAASADSDPAGARSPWDPWERFNRKMFAFNEDVDHFVLEPVATGWDYVVPHRVETCISNFFENLMLPTRFANDLLQLKPWKAYETLWRAVINTTVGLGGFFDPASVWDVYKSDEDFGQTLGYWGTPAGPYLVLPLLGPSNPRDTAGLVVDSIPYLYIPPYTLIPIYASVPGTAVQVVNRRALALETIREERKAAFDWYAAVRSAWTQNRENRVHDQAAAPVKPGATPDEDLYDVDE